MTKDRFKRIHPSAIASVAIAGVTAHRAIIDFEIALSGIVSTSFPGFDPSIIVDNPYTWAHKPIELNFSMRDTFPDDFFTRHAKVHKSKKSFKKMLPLDQLAQSNQSKKGFRP